jgi:hypothetical protein
MNTDGHRLKRKRREGACPTRQQSRNQTSEADWQSAAG